MNRSTRTRLLRASLFVPRSPRLAVSVEAELLARETSPVDVSIINFSKSGCFFRSGMPLSVGTSVMLAIPGGGMHGATIVRVDGTEHGAAFRFPLSDRELVAIAAAAVDDTDKEIAADEPAPTGARGLLYLLKTRLG